MAFYLLKKNCILALNNYHNSMEEKRDFEKQAGEAAKYLAEDVSPLEFEDSRDEYIAALEAAVLALQREVAELRGRAQNQKVQHEIPQEQTSSLLNKLLPLIRDIADAEEALSSLHSCLADEYDIIESNIFLYDSSRRLKQAAEAGTSSELTRIIKHFEESGIADWAIERETMSVVPNLSGSESAPYVIVIPLMFKGGRKGIFTSLTTKTPDDFSSEQMAELTAAAAYTATAIDNISSSLEMEKMNARLTALNSQMLRSARLASIGELASSIAREIESPLLIIDGHLNLLESGVGDSLRRIDIIRGQISIVKDILKRLSAIAAVSTADKPAESVNICALIEEILLFTKARLQSDDIKVETIFEDKNMRITAFKSQLEQVLLALLLNARESMQEGGKITIGVFSSPDKLIISFTDTGEGYNEAELEHIFDPFYSGERARKQPVGLFLARNIIKQHGGELSAFSELGLGSTFKIVLPREFA